MTIHGKRLISLVLSVVLIFSAALPATATDSQALPNAQGVFSDVERAIAALKLRLEEYGEQITFEMVIHILCEFNRGVGDFIAAQFMSDAEVDAAVKRVLDSSQTSLIYDETLGIEIIQTDVPIDINCDDLLNLRVLRKVCSEFYERQFEQIPEGRTDLDITPYEHYVGELAMHVLAFRFLDALGGYDSIFPDIYFKTIEAQLNVNEDRYVEVIKFLGDLLA